MTQPEIMEDGNACWNQKSDVLRVAFQCSNPDYLFVIFLAWTKLFQLHDACFIPYLPGNDLSGVFAVIGLDDRPAAVMAVMAAPFEVMQVACHVDLLDDGITIAGFMGGLN